MTSSPKPRRLFELLEEQQEPFILKNGFSRRSFKSKYAFRCWKLNSHALRRRACILSGLHTKLVYWQFIKRALNWERLKLGDCFSEVRTETKAAYFHRLSSSSVELSGDIGLKDIEHSPVSVLALHYDQGSSDRNHSMKKEDASTSRLSSPTMSMPQLESKRELYQQRQLLLNYLKEMEEQCCDPCEFLGQKLSGNIMGEDILPLEKQRENLPIFTQLLGLDLSATQREWTQFQAERREIVKEIGCIIFEEMREECVFDMLLGFHCTFGT